MLISRNSMWVSTYVLAMDGLEPHHVGQISSRNCGIFLARCQRLQPQSVAHRLPDGFCFEPPRAESGDLNRGPCLAL